MSNKHEQYKIEVPDWDRDAVWMDIEAALPPQEKRRRIGLLWWGIGILLVGILGIGLRYMVTTGSTHQPAPDNPTQPAIAHTQAASQAPQHTTEQSTTPAPSNTAQPAKAHATHTPLAQAKSSSHPSSTPASPAESLQTMASSKKMKTTPANSSLATNSEQPKQEAELAQNTQSATPTSPARPLGKSTDDQRVTRLQFENINSITLRAFDLVQRKIVEPMPLSPSVIDEDESDTDRFGLQFAYHIGLNQLHFSGAPAAKKSGEATLESHAFQLTIPVISKQHWSIRTGLGYERSIREVSASDRRLIDTYWEASDSAYYYPSREGIKYVAGDIEVKKYETNTIYSPSKHHRLFLPLLLEWQPSDKWNIRSGIWYNFYKKDEGYFIGQNGDLVYKNDEEGIAQLYDRKVHRLSAGVNYMVIDMDMLNMGLGLRIMTDLNSHSSLWSERISTLSAGVTLGF